jgi:GNAT superfamily N-acetyltransferase
MNLSEVEIIILKPKDWEIYKKLRLQALSENPLVFDASPEEEKALSDKEWQNRLRSPNGFKLGLKSAGKWAGKAEVEWKPAKKLRHNAEVYGVYLEQKYRGFELTQYLFEYIEKEAKKHGIRRLWFDIILSQQISAAAYPKIKEKLENRELASQGAQQHPHMAVAFNCIRLGFRTVGRLEKIIRVRDEFYDKLMMEKLI